MNREGTAKKLRELRGKRPLTEVSKDLKISTSALGAYETAKRTPRDEVKIRIAKYYGKSVEEIFFSNQLHVS